MSNLISRKKKLIREELNNKKKEFNLSGKLKDIDLHFVFSDRSSKIKSKEVIFSNLSIDTALIRELLTSFYLTYAKHNEETFVAKFNIRLFSKKEVEDYPFDRNNDVAYLHFKKYCKQYYKLQKDAAKVNLGKFIESIV